jgi:radical SAM protein with 4Fe4S-binding SPASM domain
MSSDRDDREREAAPTVPDMPSRVLIDLRTDCNLKCPMCIVHGETDDPRLKAFLRRSMSLAQARAVLDEIMASKPLIQPNLWSEPLLAHDFKAHIRHMKERGLTVALNTNGLLLREDMAKFFVEMKVDSVSISIDATTKETLKKVRGIDKLEKIEKSVSVMLQARGERLVPRVGVSFTLQDANRHERDAFVQRWVGRVDFVRVGELFEDGRFPGIKPTGPRKPCPSLYNTMAIHTNGNVSYCCLDGFGETSLGNIFEDGGVKAVWHGEKFREIRHLHETGQYDKVPFCQGCDRWISNDYQEEIVDGLLIRRSAEYTYYNRVDKLENWHGSLLGAHTLANPDKAAE